jgi:hypothetical protein
MEGAWGMAGGMIAMGLVLVLVVLAIFIVVVLLRRTIAGDPQSAIRQGALCRLDLTPVVPLRHTGRAPSGEVDGILVIPDISGYTQFMQMSAFALAHAQYAISALLNSMIDAAEGVLATAKIEGDAVLLYGVRGADDAQGGQSEAEVGATVCAVIGAFYRKRAELHAANACLCEACGSVDKLELKTVVHSGRLLLYELRGQQELSGLPVIVAHRLLKSAVGHERYVLVTDAAEQAVTLPLEATRRRHSQHYEGVGEVGGTVHVFEPAQLLAGEELPAASASTKAMDAARKLTEGLRALRGASVQ